MSHVEVVQGDCVDRMRQWASGGLQVDAVVTDPPYHLTSIVKRFGAANAAPAQYGKDGAAARLSRGFMGAPSDAGDVAFRTETWEALRAVLRPGGRAAVFGGTRTFWKTAAALDAAGFEYEDTLAWCYGQGLVLKRTRLKPNWEPILLVRAPGRVLPLNIEECRIPSNGGHARVGEDSQERRYAERGATNFAALPGPRDGDPAGRWPGNLLHDNSSEVLGCLPDAPGQQGDLKNHTRNRPTKTAFGDTKPAVDHLKRGDAGSAARFFTACAFEEDEQRLLYHPKAPASERMQHCTICDATVFPGEAGTHIHGQENADHLRGHPTVKPVQLIEHLVRLITPPGGLVLDCFAGTGTTGVAALRAGRSALLVEQTETYVADICARLASVVSLR